MKKNLTLILIVCCFSVYAQQEQTTPAEKNRIGKFILKWSPLHLYSRFPTFQLALEHRINDTYSIQYDFGPCIHNNEIDKTETHKRGFKSKLQVRRYLSSDNRHWKFFVAPEIYYNQVDFRTGETYRITAQNNIEYYKYIQFNRRYEEQGVALNFGTAFIARQVFIDFQIGIAARHVYYSKGDRPESGKYESVTINEKNTIILPYELNTSLFRPTGCVRIGFIIK